MSKTVAGTRFEKARKELSDTLKELEEVVKDKIHEVSKVRVSPSFENEGDRQEIENRLSEQLVLVQNLNSEVNKLQHALSEVGRESEFLREKNKALVEKVATFQKRKLSLVKAIEENLVAIEEVVKGA